MKRRLLLTFICTLCTTIYAQHTFQGVSLSDALIELDQSSKRYDISFVYDELEDFTVSKTIKRGCSLPDAVREVCGFYPVRVTVKGKDILVECINKGRNKLTGHLVDTEGQPIAYANIMILQPSDSSLLNGGVSNEAGDFVIPCTAERALVRISCVGLKTVERLLPIAPVGTIVMQMENIYLRNVSVNGHFSIISYQGGRLQYIVRQDQFLKGLSAFELLSHVPMVSVIADQPSILGRGPARFMLNGRVLEPGENAMPQKLLSLQAEDIERIELISVPSGRFHDEHGGGFINIVTRNDEALGWRSDIGMMAMRSKDWSGRVNGSVNYASEKLDWSADITGSKTVNTQETHYELERFPLLGSDHSDYSNRSREKLLKASALVRYNPVQMVELGGMLSFQIGKTFNALTDASVYNINSSNSHILPRRTCSSSSVEPVHPAHTFNLTAYCDWHLDNKGKISSLTYNYYRKGESTLSTVNSNQLQEDGSSQPIGIASNESDNTYHIQSIKFDNSLPYPFATIEAGVNYSIISNYANIVNTKGNTDIQVNELNEHHTYEEKALAYYFAVNKDITESFSIYAGLRYERSWVKRRADEWRNGIEISLTGNNSSYHHYLPTIRLSHQLKHKGHLGLQWGISIHRPYFYELSPTILYRNIDANISGNPALQPGSVQHLEINYNDSRNLYATLYYQYVSNQAIMTTSNYQTMPVDGFNSNKAGLLLNYRKSFSDRLNLMAECEGYYYSIKDKNYNNNQDISKNGSRFIDRRNVWIVHMPPLKGWAGRLCLAADLYLNQKKTLLLNLRYNQWLNDFKGMDKYRAYALPEMSLHYTMPDRQLKLSLTVRDPFRQYVTDMTRQYSDNMELFHTRHDMQSVSLTAIYTIGERKVRRIHHDMKNTETKRAEKQFVEPIN